MRAGRAKALQAETITREFGAALFASDRHLPTLSFSHYRLLSRHLPPQLYRYPLLLPTSPFITVMPPKSRLPPRLPRIFVLRHSHTAWSVSGQHTGVTDIPLLPEGEESVRTLGPKIVGDGKLLDPAHLKHIFVSPRLRAQQTYRIIFESLGEKNLPEYETEELVREWGYGDYEGKKTHEIRAMEGNEKWDIWTDGCVGEGSETAQQMSDRCDEMIAKILKLTESHHESKTGAGDDCHGDILIVSHGHFSRCFITRWTKLALTHGRISVADAGAISILGYQHESFDERSLLAMNLFGAQQS